MRSGQNLPLPQAEPEYNQIKDQQMRRAVEFSFEDVRNDIVATRNASDKDASLALRRHQFLLMGAS
jgi:hypothetical protein